MKDIQWPLIWELLKQFDDRNSAHQLDHKFLEQKISNTKERIETINKNYQNAILALQQAVSLKDSNQIEKSLRSLKESALNISGEIKEVSDNIDALTRVQRLPPRMLISMTLEDAKRKLFENQKSEGDSFLDFLHGRKIFNPDEFWELYNSLAMIQSSDLVYDSEIRQAVFSIYSCTLNAIIWHNDPRDTPKIRNLPTEISQYASALNWVSKYTILGQKIARFDEFNHDELANPRASELREYFIKNGFRSEA
jgi:hypothetical protein